MNTWPILDSVGYKCIIWGTFFEKKGILFAHTPETDDIFNHF